MKKVSKRAYSALIIAGVIIAGLIILIVMYFMSGKAWAMHPANQNLYSGGNIKTGMVRDEDGAVLMYTDGSKRLYSDNSATRKALLHVMGDSYGYIPSVVQTNYAGKLVGYDAINGTYSLTEKSGTLYLSLNAEVCVTAMKALGSRKGTVGVYNYKTGEIICMVSTPTYDPDDMPDIFNDETGAYSGVFVNRFIASTYTPGSIFKLVTSAAAIDNISDIFEQSFYCDGSVWIEGDEIVCAGVHGWIDFGTALARSCNCAFASIATQLGKETLTEYAKKAGITDTISFDGMTTAPGNFNLSGAQNSDVAWAGIGQYSNTINPCSYMTYMGTIANGGSVVYPHVAWKIENALTIPTYTAETKKGSRVLSESTSQTLKSMMRNNTLMIYGDPYDLGICAKSGTAEVGGDVLPHATYAGFLDDTEHPYAFIIIVENGGSGSAVCSEIANAVLYKAVTIIGND